MNSLFYDKAGVPTSEQLTTYSDSLIFDTVNSTIYTKQKNFGNRVETSVKNNGSFPLAFLDRSNGLAFTYSNSLALYHMTLNELQVPNLWLKTSSNYGSKLSFGDKDFAYIKETTDNILTVYSSGTIFHSTTNPFYFNNKKVVASAGFEGNLSGFATSSGVSNRLSVKDYRDSVTHGPSYYTTQRVTASFENNGGPTSGCNSFLSIYGWTGSNYKVWQIGSNADNNTTNQNLYFRTSNSITNNTWHPWKRVITDKDTEVYVNSLFGKPNYTYLLGIQTSLNGVNDHINIYGVDSHCPFAYLYSTTGDNDGSHYLWATEMRSNLFRGSLSGNATTASTATNANNIKVTVTATNANYPLILGPSTTAGGTIGTGNKSLYIDNENNLYYNPSTNTLTTTNFAGTATNATNINVTTSSTNNDNYRLTFVNGTGNCKAYTNATISVNPGSGKIIANQIKGSAGGSWNEDVEKATTYNGCISSFSKWAPVCAVRTKGGVWSMGHIWPGDSQNYLTFSYVGDSIREENGNVTLKLPVPKYNRTNFIPIGDQQYDGQPAVARIVTLSSSQYNNLTSKDPNTLYLII